jgi:hypothetical protein
MFLQVLILWIIAALIFFALSPALPHRVQKNTVFEIIGGVIGLPVIIVILVFDLIYKQKKRRNHDV